MVKNIDEKENSFQDELQEDILNNNNNPSGIYLLWQNLLFKKNCYLKQEKCLLLAMGYVLSLGYPPAMFISQLRQEIRDKHLQLAKFFLFFSFGDSNFCHINFCQSKQIPLQKKQLKFCRRAKMPSKVLIQILPNLSLSHLSQVNFHESGSQTSVNSAIS